MQITFPEGQEVSLKVYVMQLPETLSAFWARRFKSNWSCTNYYPFLAVGTGEQSPNPPLTWLSNEPVWVDQWPMTEE